MNAQELRIGNLIIRQDLVNDHDRIEKIIELGKKALITGPINVLCEYSKIKPILLTEKWLIKFGFEKAKQPNGAIFYGQRNKKFRFTENKRNEYYLFGYEYPVEIQYVHQLQNLYLALTGEELTIK